MKRKFPRPDFLATGERPSQERRDLSLPGLPLIPLLEQHFVLVVRDVADLQPADVITPADVCRWLVAIVKTYQLVRDLIRSALLHFLVVRFQDGVEARPVRKYRVTL